MYIYLGPIPALEKGKASQNGNIKSLEAPLLEVKVRDYSPKDRFQGM